MAKHKKPHHKPRATKVVSPTRIVAMRNARGTVHRRLVERPPAKAPHADWEALSARIATLEAQLDELLAIGRVGEDWEGRVMLLERIIEDLRHECDGLRRRVVRLERVLGPQSSAMRH